MSRLEVGDGESRTLPPETTVEYEGADVYGDLKITNDGCSLELIDDAAGVQPGQSPISLPLEINFSNMQIGNALFITLSMGLLMGAVGFLKNYAAGVMLMLALFTLIVSGLLGLGLEIFWSMIAATALLLIVGMVFRWST